MISIKSALLITLSSLLFNKSALAFNFKDAYSGGAKDTLALINQAKKMSKTFFAENTFQKITQDKEFTSKSGDTSLSLPPFDKFYSSKRELAKHLKKNPKTFYLGCDIKFSGRGKFSPDLRSCNYINNGNPTRSRRIEWEHLVPASFGRDVYSCWKNGGRKNCQNSPEFQTFEADPVNLVPSIGEVNGNRSNYKYGDLSTGFSYGSNEKVLFNSKLRLFMPPEEKKGRIGRVHLYITDKYKIKYSDDYLSLMKRWARKPALKEECDYNRLTSSWGFENKYSTAACQ